MTEIRPYVVCSVRLVSSDELKSLQCVVLGWRGDGPDKPEGWGWDSMYGGGGTSSGLDDMFSLSR